MSQPPKPSPSEPQAFSEAETLLPTGPSTRRPGDGSGNAGPFDPFASGGGSASGPTPANLPGWAGVQPQQLPATLGRYQLLRQIGKGAMGAVYLGVDTQLDRQVAVKIPRFDLGAEPEAKERFLREARTAATLQHANICPVYDYGQIGGVHYLTMGYIEGKSLQEVMAKAGRLPPAQAVGLIRQLAVALAEAHAKGIIHRDLKPANVMINVKKQAVIMDFGLAKRVSPGGAGQIGDVARLTQTGLIMGTPNYMSPEQVNGDVKAQGPGCDIYSLGVILFELLTGELPFQGMIGDLMVQILTVPAKPPSAVRPEIDPALDAIVLKALAKKPHDRYPSMPAFAVALHNYLTGKATAAVPQANVGPRGAAPVGEATVESLPLAQPEEGPKPVRRSRGKVKKAQSRLPLFLMGGAGIALIVLAAVLVIKALAAK